MSTTQLKPRLPHARSVRSSGSKDDDGGRTNVGQKSFARRRSEGRLAAAGGRGPPATPLDADGLPFIEMLDLIALNERVSGRHILRRRQHAFTRVPRTLWTVPRGDFVATQELTDEFCGAHEIARTDLASITLATELVRRFLKKRSRVREIVHSFATHLRALKAALLRYVYKRRALLQRLTEEWAGHERAEREEYRQLLAAKFKAQRRLRNVANVSLLNKRAPLLSDEETQRFQLVPVSVSDKLEIIKYLLRRAFAAFHRRMGQWRQQNQRKADAVRRRCLVNFGSVLSLPLMLHRARIPDPPPYVFRVTHDDLKREHCRRVEEREERELAAFRAGLDAQTAGTRHLLDAIAAEEAARILNRPKLRASLRDAEAAAVFAGAEEGSRAAAPASAREVDAVWQSRAACCTVAPHDWLQGCARCAVTQHRPAPRLAASAAGCEDPDGACAQEGKGASLRQKSRRRLRLERRASLLQQAPAPFSHGINAFALTRVEDDSAAAVTSAAVEPHALDVSALGDAQLEALPAEQRLLALRHAIDDIVGRPHRLPCGGNSSPWKGEGPALQGWLTDWHLGHVAAPPAPPSSPGELLPVYFRADASGAVKPLGVEGDGSPGGGRPPPQRFAPPRPSRIGAHNAPCAALPQLAHTTRRVAGVPMAPQTARSGRRPAQQQQLRWPSPSTTHR